VTRRPADPPTGPDADPVAGPDADPVAVARSIALDALTAAPRTRAQLAATLAKRGVPDDAAAEVLDRFGEVGLIDDAAFARAWVTSRQAGRGLAPRALAAELRQRGVAHPLIADAVAELDDEAVEAAALQLARRKAAATAGMPREVRMRRLVALLARKGYSAAIVTRVAREVLAGEANADHSGGEVDDDSAPAGVELFEFADDA
jgi:regulatory protein